MAQDQRIKDLATAVAAAVKAQRGISAFCAGAPGASEIIGRGVAPYSFAVSNVGACVATADTPATAAAVFTIKAGAVQIGTITFSAGASAGVFAFSTTAITKGQVLTITAPATADATLTNITILIPN